MQAIASPQLRVLTTLFDQYFKIKLESFMMELISPPESIEIIIAEQPFIFRKFEGVPSLLPSFFFTLIKNVKLDVLIRNRLKKGYRSWHIHKCEIMFQMVYSLLKI